MILRKSHLFVSEIIIFYSQVGLDCIRFGSNGLAHVKPEDGGGLGQIEFLPGDDNDDENEDEDDYDYDDDDDDDDDDLLDY